MSSSPWGPHGPQSNPYEVTPNPTPSYVPPPPDPTPAYVPSAPAQYYAPSSYAPQGSNQVNYASVGSKPRRKGYIVALILTFLFGPLGLFYATKKGALILLFLLFAVPITLSVIGGLPGGSPTHPFAILDHDSIMQPIWSLCAFVSMVWSVIAVNRYNAALKAKA